MRRTIMRMHQTRTKPKNFLSRMNAEKETSEGETSPGDRCRDLGISSQDALIRPFRVVTACIVSLSIDAKRQILAIGIY